MNVCMMQCLCKFSIRFERRERFCTFYTLVILFVCERTIRSYTLTQLDIL